MASHGKFVFVTDADLPGRPEDILRLLQALRDGAAVAVASRGPLRCTLPRAVRVSWPALFTERSYV